MGSKKERKKRGKTKHRDFCNGARKLEHRQSFVPPKSISRNCWWAEMATVMATNVLELPRELLRIPS
jgi:hypothetical protein